MRLTTTLILLLTAAPAVAAADPAPVMVPAGVPADLSITVPTGASVVWRISPQPPWRAKGLPEGRLIFAGKTGTEYVATAIVVDFTAKTVTDMDYTFRFGDPIPPPPPPPPLPPPGPQSELGRRFQAAFDGDPPADPVARKKSLLTLAELYAAAAEFAADKSLPNTEALFARIVVARDSTFLGIVGLTGVRAVATAELKTTFPEDVELTEATRQAAADLFKRLSAALKEVR